MIKYSIFLWRKWSIKAGLSVLEQCVFSAANFILNILLVRWLVPSAYGVFVIAFSVFLFISGFQNAIILEPMSVIGASRYKEQIAPYLRIISSMHWLLNLAFSAILVIAVGVMAVGRNALTFSLLGLAIATPFILFFWVFRQACYLEIKPGLALMGNLFYGVILIVGIVILRRQNLLSPFSAFIIMALASILASIWLWRFITTKHSDSLVPRKNINIRTVALEHWHYGKWVVGSAFVNWFSSIVYLPLIAVLVGFQEAGAFRAMQNLTLPLERSLVGLGLLLLPWLSRQRLAYGKGDLKNKLLKIILINFSFASGYVFLIILFGKYITAFLYGQSYAINFIWLLPYIGIVTVLNAIAIALYTGFKALERPDIVFWSQALGAFLTLSIGLYLVRSLKLYGAAVGSILTAASITLVFFYFLLWRWKR